MQIESSDRMNNSISDQFRRNVVALISLVVAVTSLFYATWRNQKSEHNRNIRTAAFEVLKNLGELQTIANYAHFQKDRAVGNPLMGWGRVLVINDLCSVLPSPAAEESKKLTETWQNNWETLGKEDESIDAIVNEIETTRKAILKILCSLQ
jgi:hypothetical protein